MATPFRGSAMFYPHSGVLHLPPTEIVQAWEELLSALERGRWITNNECVVCGAVRDETVETVLIHCRGCRFQVMDEAVARLRAGGR